MQKIPLIDLTNKTLVDLCEEQKQRGVDLLQATKNSFGLLSRIASFIALPLGDHFSRKILRRTGNPYKAEIDKFARIMNVKGVYALNLSYEWGCTSGVFKTDKSPQLVRVLDCPFPGLGENTVIARQWGSAGMFHNITWPGIAGVFQAVAPGRFAAALNQAPMRKQNAGIVIDWIVARFRMARQEAFPPAHLLRRVFETARNYVEAKKLLCEIPVAIPVIYILSGTKPEEGCVIERTERKAHIRELGANQNIAAANDFSPPLAGEAKDWRPRGVDNIGREKQLCSLSKEAITADNFNWFQYPVANHLTRLVVVTDAATGDLRVMGTEAEKPVTEVFKR